MQDGSVSGDLTSIRPFLYDDGSAYSNSTSNVPTGKWTI